MCLFQKIFCFIFVFLQIEKQKHSLKEYEDLKQKTGQENAQLTAKLKDVETALLSEKNKYEAEIAKLREEVFNSALLRSKLQFRIYFLKCF